MKDMHVVSDMAVATCVMMRVCAVPLELYREAVPPDLHGLLLEHEACRAGLERAAEAAVAALDDVVNAGGWSREETKKLGTLRRRVARRAPPQPVDGETLGWLAERAAPLAAEIEGVFGALARRDGLLDEIAARLEAGAEAVLPEVWARIAGAPALAALVREHDAAFFGLCSEGAEEAGFWSGKRGRHRAKYLKTILQRGTFRTVPRGWYTYAGFAAVQGGPTGPLVVAARKAASHAVNFHDLRRRASEDWAEGDDVPLMLSPLNWRDGERIGFCVSGWANPAKVSEISLRRSDFLGRVLEAMEGHVLSAKEIAGRMDGAVTPEETEILPAFLAHLLEKGVVQACPQAGQSLSGWAAPGRLSAPAHIRARPHSFTDVYTGIEGAVSADQLERVQAGMADVARLSALIEGDRAGQAGPGDARAASGSVPLLSVVRARLLKEERAGGAPVPSGGTPAAFRACDWPLPSSRQGAYARLHGHIGSRLGGAGPITLPGALLEGGGAAPVWPRDAMVRLAGPAAGFCGVFDESFVAGSMDARFLGAAERLGHDLPQKAFYEEFLTALQGDHGIRFVELLFPPLSLGAANAVIRPRYLDRWTGDPDCGSYFQSETAGMEFLSLERFGIERTARGQRLTCDGERIFAMYHATRLPLPPWDVLTNQMLNAAPPFMRVSSRRLHRVLDAFPEAASAPPVQTESGLVVSCAQWRLRPEEHWAPEDGLLDKMRGLARLRRDRGVPRFVFLSPGPGLRPEVCDLDDPLSPRKIEEAAETAPDLLAIAMTPDETTSLVKSALGTHAACALVRYPLGRGPGALAEGAAAELKW